MPLRLCPMSLGCSHEQSECQSCIPEFHLDMSMYVCSTCSSKRCCRLLALDLLSVAMASKQGAKPKIQAKARPQEAPQQPPPTVIASGSRPGASKPSSEMRPPEPSNPPRKPQQQTPPDQVQEPQRQQQSQPGPQQHPAGQTPKAAGQAGLHNQGATAPAAPLQQAWAAGQQASRPTTQAAWPQAVHNQRPYVHRHHFYSLEHQASRPAAPHPRQHGQRLFTTRGHLHRHRCSLEHQACRPHSPLSHHLQRILQTQCPNNTTHHSQCQQFGHQGHRQRPALHPPSLPPSKEALPVSTAAWTSGFKTAQCK